MFQGWGFHLSTSIEPCRRQDWLFGFSVWEWNQLVESYSTSQKIDFVVILVRSKQNAFLTFQICHRIHGNLLLVSAETFCFRLSAINWWKLRKTELWEARRGKWKSRSLPSLRAGLQWKRTWHILSSCKPHLVHIVSKAIPRVLRCWRTASAPDKALHKNCLSFGGAFVFQRLFHSYLSRGGNCTI